MLTQTQTKDRAFPPFTLADRRWPDTVPTALRQGRLSFAEVAHA